MARTQRMEKPALGRPEPEVWKASLKTQTTFYLFLYVDKGMRAGSYRHFFQPIEIFKNHDSAGHQNPLTFPRHCGEGRNPWGVTLTRR
ncbi:MAG: hypothetical protein Q4G70_06630 [Pseudomonadota bacterium]|nr:hypothetical protein [Pseudomonadota bacterium]